MLLCNDGFVHVWMCAHTNKQREHLQPIRSKRIASYMPQTLKNSYIAMQRYYYPLNCNYGGLRLTNRKERFWRDDEMAFPFFSEIEDDTHLRACGSLGLVIYYRWTMWPFVILLTDFGGNSKYIYRIFSTVFTDFSLSICFCSEFLIFMTVGEMNKKIEYANLANGHFLYRFEKSRDVVLGRFGFLFFLFRSYCNRKRHIRGILFDRSVSCNTFRVLKLFYD